MKIYVSYVPELWPLVDRAVAIQLRVLSPEDDLIFRITGARVNSSGLIGALIGPSRDATIKSLCKELVGKTIAELRKGTKAVGGAYDQQRTQVNALATIPIRCQLDCILISCASAD
jgi:hypothetical protein